MTIPAIPVIQPVDLVPERLETGDTNDFITKTNARDAKLEAFSAQVSAQSAEVVLLPDRVNDAVTAAMADNATASGQILAMQNTQPNLLPDHGSLIEAPADAIKGGNYGFGNNSAPYRNNALDVLSSYNGSNSDSSTEQERFVYNSTTYSGGEAEVPLLSRLFAEAMGCATRYLPAFALARVVAGTGTVGNVYDGCYRFYSTNSLLSLCPQGKASLSFWCRLSFDDGFFRGYNVGDKTQSYINGQQVFASGGDSNSRWHRLTAGTIYHLAVSVDAPSTDVLLATVGELLLKPEGLIIIASPWLSHGAFQMLPHTRPVRSYT